MVRTKSRAKRYLACCPETSDDSSSYSEPDTRSEMVRSEVLTELRTKQLPEKLVPCTPEGYWTNGKYHFLTKTGSVRDSFYYRDISSLYDRFQDHGQLSPYDEAEVNSRFANLGMSNAPYPLKDSFANASHEDMDRAIRSAFQLGPEIEWRWPEPGERIYHRSVDGFVPVWLEHLRGGWHPRSHLFFKHLCKYIYKLSPMQITPNGIKWVSWFLACCNKLKYQPMFKLFHQLFSLVKSSVRPLYELRFRAVECGFNPGQAKPVMMQSSLKHWNRELLLLKGLDLYYLPYIAIEGVVTDFPVPVLEGRALKQIYDFYNCLGL